MAKEKFKPKSYNFKYRGYKLLFTETRPDRVEWTLEDPKGKPCGEEDSGFNVTQTQAISSAKECVDLILDGDNVDDFTEGENDYPGEEDSDE